MKLNKNNYSDEIIAATSLLLSISTADDNIDNNEIDVINEILIDFFHVTEDDASEIIQLSLETLNSSTDIYEFGRTLNNSFKYQDKIDFICCAFEVAYADGDLLRPCVLRALCRGPGEEGLGAALA